MSNANNNLTWQERLRYEFRRNKRKTVILTVLMLLAVVMVARLVFKKPPAKAQASALVVPQADPAGPAPVPAAGARGPTAPASAGATAGTASGAPSGRSKSGTPVKVEFVRDIFKPDPAVFEAREEADAATPDEVRIQIQLEANALRLTSTMVGQVSFVTINGQLLKLEDWIEGFQVVKITKGFCIVAKKGIRVQLDMES